ncbi:DUF1835 domain-containing protein [Agarivorans sp. QJM3NY_33]|uniref:DUF1835 domain-containing protein n=1 Tax=Agarivorans sp. QJM3NY_33 TaxID=3421432 RepID=UPI003D7E99FD
MSSRNAFVLNLSYLKAQAKRRLKLIKSGNAEQYQIFRRYHPQAHHLEGIKLADIQLVIARELGLASWAALKVHIEQQNQHLQAISSDAAPLDAELNTLHIRCGHDLQHLLPRAGFKGDFLAWIDPYCLGPLSLDEATLLRVRAEFVVQHYLSELTPQDADIDAVIAGERAKRAQLNDPQYQQIVLWLEHDNYDQLMMIYLLAIMTPALLSKTKIIEVNQFPGTSRYVGLGQLPAQALRSVWQSRQSATTKMQGWASRVWHALCQDNPEAIVAILNSDIDHSFKQIKPVLMRYLQELPHTTNGLSLTQRIALQLLAEAGEQGLIFRALFHAYQQRESLPFLGDLMFWALIKPLSQGEAPLIDIHRLAGEAFSSASLTINTEGFSCLQARTKWLGADDQLGGMNISSQNAWQWDHQHLASLNYRHWHQDLLGSVE